MEEKNLLNKKGRPDAIKLYNLLYPSDEITDEFIKKDRQAVTDKTRKIDNWIKGKNYPKNISEIMALCNAFGCDMDYFFTDMQCKTHDKQFIQDYTGLSEKSIDVLETEKYLKSSHCIKIINILLNDLWTHPESRNTKYSFINLFANYLRFCIDGNHKYALSKNGNIKIDPKPNMIDIDGKAMYSIADIHFTSEQLEKMFIMEIEDVLKALKESYVIQKQKAPDTN